MDLHLKGKVALITGGARGLGAAICTAIATEGAHVAVNFCRSKAPAEELVEQLRSSFGVSAVCLQGDVSQSSDVSRVFDGCYDQLGNIDILVNNAGIWPKAYVHEIEEAAWDQTLAINLKGPFLTCREAVRRWQSAGCGGRIINVSSPAAFLGATTGHADYAASKAALCNFTVSLAREVAAHGIYVNAVAPGMMETDMAAEALEKNLDHYLQRIPLRRIGQPEEIAAMIAFLASGRASYTTGATFDVSGGMLMR